MSVEGESFTRGAMLGKRTAFLRIYGTSVVTRKKTHISGDVFVTCRTCVRTRACTYVHIYTDIWV